MPTCWLSGRMHAVWSPDGPQDGTACMPYLVRLSVVVACLKRAASGVYASALRSPPVGVDSGCQAWSCLKRFGSSVAQPRSKAKYHGGCTEEDGGEPDFEVSERQGDDASGQQHYYPGHVVSRYQLRPQPAVAPTVSVLGEPLELRWIIHPDRHLTACGAQTVLAVMVAGGPVMGRSGTGSGGVPTWARQGRSAVHLPAAGGLKLVSPPIVR